MSVRAGLVTLLVIAAGAALLAIRALTQLAPPALVGDARINGLIAYQVVSALLAICVVLLARAMAPGGRRFLAMGTVSAPAGLAAWLGIRAGEPWSHVGRNFAIILTVATAAAVYFQVVSTASLQPSFAGIVVALLVAVPFAGL